MRSETVALAVFQRATDGKAMSNNRRRLKRRPIDLAGVVQDVDGKALGPAMLRNISPTGALLEMKSEVELPTDFRVLLTESGSVNRKCTKVWQKAALAGVKFVD